MVNCPNCGSDRLTNRGERTEDEYRIIKYYCRDCGNNFEDVINTIPQSHVLYNPLTRSRSYSHIQKEGFNTQKHLEKKLKDPVKWLILILGVVVGSFFNMWFTIGAVFLFFYMIFPNEFKILNAAEEEYFKKFPASQVDPVWIEEYMETHGGHIGFSYICKFFSIGFFAFSFWQLYMPLALAVMFIGYFSFPAESDKKRQIDESIGWYVSLKPIFGLAMAVLMGWLFSSVILGLMTAAFFVFIPQKKNITESFSEARNIKEFITGPSAINGLIFLIPMIIAVVVIYSPLSQIQSLILMIILELFIATGAAKGSKGIILIAAPIILFIAYFFVNFFIPLGSQYGWGLSLDSTVGVLVAAVWFVALLSGLSSTPASRPYVGMIMIPILLLAYTVVFPATVGTAVFGAWWPAVDGAITSVTAPLGDAWAQAAAGTGSAWLMMSNPSLYYEQEQARLQAQATVKSGGTTKSIEVSEFEFIINNIPEQPLLASATLENKGEFKASNINVKLMQAQTKGKDGKGGYNPEEGVLYKLLTCSGTKPEKAEGSTYEDSCAWKEASYNGDMKLLTFTYGSRDSPGDKGWDTIGNCECDYSDKTSEKCETSADDFYGCKYCKIGDKKCADGGGTIGYKSAGKTVRVGFNYSFDYIVNVSLDLQLMQPETLNDMLMKKQIRLQGVEAQYSGGPVRASIWTQKQPLRAGEDTLMVITITNQGGGTIKKGADYVLTMPYIGETAPEGLIERSASGLNCKKNDGGLNIEDKSAEKTKVLRCKLDKDLPKGKDAKFGFTFNYPIPSDVDRKTALLVGNVNYEYENSYTKDTQIIWIPPQ